MIEDTWLQDLWQCEILECYFVLLGRGVLGSGAGVAAGTCRRAQAGSSCAHESKAAPAQPSMCPVWPFDLGDVSREDLVPSGGANHSQQRGLLPGTSSESGWAQLWV